MAIASAATTNVRRIQRYLSAKMKQAEAAKRLQIEAAPATAFFGGALVTFPAGFQPDFRLLKNSFLQ